MTSSSWLRAWLDVIDELTMRGTWIIRGSESARVGGTGRYLAAPLPANAP